MSAPGTQRQLPPGLRAEVMAWPVKWVQKGFERAQGVARIRMGLEHLVRTPLGAYLVDPAYGSLFYQLRTQGMSLDDGGEGASGFAAVAVSHFEQQVAFYLPSVVLHGVTPRVRSHSRLAVHVVWTLPSVLGLGAPGATPSPGMGDTSPLTVTM